jgi:hypothetical protein
MLYVTLLGSCPAAVTQSLIWTLLCTPTVRAKREVSTSRNDHHQCYESNPQQVPR